MWWLLLSIYSLLLGQLGGFVTFEYIDADRVEYFRNDGAYVIAKATTTCYYDTERAPLVVLPRTASFESQIHELAHAYDCKDNGVIDGSPLPSSAWVSPEWPLCHVEIDRGYACWVERGMGMLR